MKHAWKVGCWSFLLWTWGGLLGVETPITFSADKAQWDLASNTVTLKDHVEIQREGFAFLTSLGEVQLGYESGDAGSQARWVKTQGETHLRYEDLQKKCHCLTCYGLAQVDLNAFTATLESPPEGGADKQLLFEDDLGLVRADRALVKWSMENRTPALASLIAEGNVKMWHKGSSVEEVSSQALHSGSADVVEVYPPQRKVRLSAAEGRRVVLYDWVNQVEMTAAAINVTRGDVSQKPIYEGEGDVRFTFMEKGAKQLSEWLREKEKGDNSLSQAE